MSGEHACRLHSLFTHFIFLCLLILKLALSYLFILFICSFIYWSRGTCNTLVSTISAEYMYTYLDKLAFFGAVEAPVYCSCTSGSFKLGKMHVQMTTVTENIFWIPAKSRMYCL